ncbi:MAG: aminotransferase class I/II-fold pyridoxal phosphate-dependent enzyme, partial [Bdellovibrionales bacterium]|nr:aminotransferase class I/II-fold pyridoxal phosphate-dependent enzyme [Bdellovibrionales bacterium]
ERTQHQANARLLKKKMKSVGLPILETPSHIIPLMVRNSGTCKAISDYLMNEESAYIQPINYPTVPAGSERLRITPTPLHTEEQMDQLVQSLLRAWEKFGLNLEFEDAPSYRVEWNEEEAAQ